MDSPSPSEQDVGAFPPGSPMPSSGNHKNVFARSPSLDGTPAKVPSFVGHTGCSDEVVAALNQALKHSGSIVTQNLRMRALQVPETLASAYNAAPKPDDLMPQFDAKVDIDNLLEKLPINVSLRAMLSLQRVTFMSTEWLGIRLVHGNHTESLRFCLCATALQNIGKNTSRSVVVECPDGDQCMVFACSPMSASRRSEWRSTFCDHAEEIGVLAHIILNDGGIAVKKVTAHLKTWCQKTQRRAEEEDQNAARRAQREADVSQVPLDAESTKQNESSKDNKRRRFSLMGIVASLEESFASLGADSKNKSSAGTGKVGAHRRRMSTPGGLGSGAPRVGSINASPERRSGSKQRRHSLGTVLPSGREEAPDVQRRERRGSDPSLALAPRGRPHSGARSAVEDPGFDATCQEDQAKAMAAKLKRRPSLADIMPTLDEDSMTSIGLKSAPLASFRSSSKRSDCESPKLKRRHSLGCLDNVGNVGQRRASK